MSDVRQWDIEVGVVIGKIYFTDSTFYEGPFDPGTNQLVMDLRAYNDGTRAGYVDAALYEYPGDTTKEKLLEKVQWYLEPKPEGLTGKWDCYQDIPIDITSWPLGIKVWGESETEPIWLAVGALILPPLAVYR